MSPEPRQALLKAIPKKPRNKLNKYYYENILNILNMDNDCNFSDFGWRCDEIGESYQDNKMTVVVVRNCSVQEV